MTRCHKFLSQLHIPSVQLHFLSQVDYIAILPNTPQQFPGFHAFTLSTSSNFRDCLVNLMTILLLKRSPQRWQPMLQRPWQIQSWCILPSLHKHSTSIAASHLSQATIVSGKKESFYSFVPTKPGSSIRFGPHDSKRHMSPLHSFRSGTGMFSAPESISLTPQSRVPRPVLEVLHQGVHQATPGCSPGHTSRTAAIRLFQTTLQE